MGNGDMVDAGHYDRLPALRISHINVLFVKLLFSNGNCMFQKCVFSPLWTLKKACY